MNKTFKDVIDNLLPGTICRCLGLRYHYVGSVKDGDLEVFVFKYWSKHRRGYRYVTEHYEALKIYFEAGRFRIERYK